MTETREVGFTPGPWSWWTSNSTRRLTCEKREPGRINQDGGVLHAYRCRDGVADICVSDADARLIAASPTMYEALRDLIPAVKEHINAAGGAGGYLLARLSDAEAALAKATEASNGE